MITITVKYEDLNDRVCNEDLYFHLYKHQAMDLLNGEGGLKKQLTNLMTTEDGEVAYDAFKMLVQASYGAKTDDGRFEKDDEATKRFMSGPAFDALIDLLESSEQVALDFVTGIFPKGMLDEAKMEAAKTSGRRGVMVDIPLPAENKLISGGSITIPEGLVRVAQEELGHRHVAETGDVPAAFRRPPVDQAKPLVALPVQEGMTREEVLAAYDKQMQSIRTRQDPQHPGLAPDSQD
jgi:hypothetical protein